MKFEQVIGKETTQGRIEILPSEPTEIVLRITLAVNKQPSTAIVVVKQSGRNTLIALHQFTSPASPKQFAFSATEIAELRALLKSIGADIAIETLRRKE